MNILFPIAGLGTRFKKSGYIDPKPFINFRGKPLLEFGNYHLLDYQVRIS